MLLLTRKAGECVMIGEEIKTVIVRVRGDNVLVGVQAPRDVPVHRGEVFNAIMRDIGGIVPGKRPSADNTTRRPSLLERIKAECVTAQAKINGGCPEQALDVINRVIAELEAAA